RPHAAISAFMFGACADPTIWSRSVFSMTIVSTFVTGAGLAARDPQPVWSTAAACGAAPAEPAKPASNIAIAQTVVLMEMPCPPSPLGPHISSTGCGATMERAADDGRATTRGGLHAPVHHRHRRPP